MTLTLTGYVPDNNVHAAMVAAAGANLSARRWSTISRPASARRQVSPPPWCRRSARCRGCPRERLSSLTAKSSCRAMRCLTPPPTQIRAGLGKDFPQGWQFKPDFRSSPPPAGSIRRSASSCFRSCSAKAQDPV